MTRYFAATAAFARSISSGGEPNSRVISASICWPVIHSPVERLRAFASCEIGGVGHGRVEGAAERGDALGRHLRRGEDGAAQRDGGAQELGDLAGRRDPSPDR